MMGKKTLLIIPLFVALEAALAAGGRHGGQIGAPANISRDDRDLQKVVLFATCFYNDQVNDAFLFKPSAIDRAQRQLVQGFRFIIDFQISRTVCRKHEVLKDLKNCDLQPEGPLHQVIWCHFEVWLIPWERKTDVQAFLCKEPTHQLQPSSTDGDPNGCSSHLYDGQHK